MNGETVVAIEGLTKRFSGKTVVDDVDLTIKRGEIVGFLGPNGSGKTTTIRMICGLLRPDAGSGTCLGYDILTQSDLIKLQVGYMTQRFSLYEDLDVQENLDFIADIYCLPRKTRRARIEAQLGRYDLIEQRRQRAGTLSGGQKQRLALAAATLHAPPLLFLDEPTSAVDPQSRRDFWETLFALVAEGTTILVSTHYMDEAERCHRLAILQRGRIVADGTPTQLYADMDARVVEVETDAPGRARAALNGLAPILSVTQLGVRLRVLVAKAIEDAPELVRSTLLAAGVEARVQPVHPSLEDVFVLATDSDGAKS
jgi:ABC-2 type transport system ATP-binding protein